LVSEKSNSKRVYCLYSLFILQNELLGLPTKKILTDDAIPTIFSFTKQLPRKRMSTEARQLKSTKRQLIADAIENCEAMERLDKENEELLIESNEKMVTSSTQSRDSVTASKPAS